MAEVLQHPETLSLWEELHYETNTLALADRSVVLAKIYEDYDATVDFPGAVAWVEMLRHNPNAKVILSLHPKGAEEWYNSAHESIFQFSTGISAFIVRTSLFARWMNRHSRFLSSFLWQIYLKGTFGRNDRAGAIALYNENVELAKRIVPANQLLIFRATDGWEPLVKFLGVDMPSVPYPHVNDREEMQARIRLFRAMAVATLCDYGGITYGIYRLLHKYYVSDWTAAAGLSVCSFALIWALFARADPHLRRDLRSKEE